MTRPAISLGLTAAPVVTIPARQARAFRVIDNRTSELTSWDTDLLPDALAGLDDLDVFSFDDVLPLAAMDGKTDPDDIPEPPKNPVTRTGNLWVLGKHRIICGDSCDQQTVERLLDGAAHRPDGDGSSLRRGLRLVVAVQGWDQHQRAAPSASRPTTIRMTGRPRMRSSQARSPTSGMKYSLALPVAARGLDACGFVRTLSHHLG